MEQRGAMAKYFKNEINYGALIIEKIIWKMDN
jgi:hypothetical protein